VSDLPDDHLWSLVPMLQMHWPNSAIKLCKSLPEPTCRNYFLLHTTNQKHTFKQQIQYTNLQSTSTLTYLLC